MQNYIWESIETEPSAELNHEDQWINNTLEKVKSTVQELNDTRKNQFAFTKTEILRKIKEAKEEDLNLIGKKIDEVYFQDPEVIAAQVMKNILTESPEMDDGTDKEDPFNDQHPHPSGPEDQ